MSKHSGPHPAKSWSKKLIGLYLCSLKRAPENCKWQSATALSDLIRCVARHLLNCARPSGQRTSKIINEFVWFPENFRERIAAFFLNCNNSAWENVWSVAGFPAFYPAYTRASVSVAFCEDHNLFLMNIYACTNWNFLFQLGFKCYLLLFLHVQRLLVYNDVCSLQKYRRKVDHNMSVLTTITVHSWSTTWSPVQNLKSSSSSQMQQFTAIDLS